MKYRQRLRTAEISIFPNLIFSFNYTNQNPSRIFFLLAFDKLVPKMLLERQALEQPKQF